MGKYTYEQLEDMISIFDYLSENNNDMELLAEGFYTSLVPYSSVNIDVQNIDFSNVDTDALENDYSVVMQDIFKNMEKSDVREIVSWVADDTLALLYNDDIVSVRPDLFEILVNRFRNESNGIDWNFLTSSKISTNYIIESLNKIKDGTASNAINILTLNSLENFLMEQILNDKVEGNIPDIINWYADYIIEDTSKPLISNSFIVLIDQISHANREDSDSYSSIRDKIDKYRDGLKDKAGYNVSLDKYDFSKDMFDISKYAMTQDVSDLLNDLLSYREQYGILPEDACDFLIKHKIHDNNDVAGQINYMYNDLFYRAYEDRARHELIRRGYPEFVTVCRETSDGIYGSEGDESKSIEFNQTEVANLSFKDVSSIDTMFHEIKHVEQDDKYGKLEIKTASDYRIAKERMIIDVNEEIYNINYNVMKCETEARLFGMMDQFLYLRKLGFINTPLLDKVMEDRYDTESQENFWQKVYRIYGKEIANIELSVDSADPEKPIFELLTEQIDGLTESNIDSEKDEQSYWRYFYKSHLEAVKENLREDMIENEHGTAQDVDAIFAEVIKDAPEKLENFPFFKIEFDENGNRRTSVEILKRFEAYVKETGKTELYDTFSFYHAYLIGETKELKYEDVVDLLEFKTDNPKVDELRNIIVEEQVIDTIDRWRVGDEQYKALYLIDEHYKNNPNKFVQKALSKKFPQYSSLVKMGKGRFEYENLSRRLKIVRAGEISSDLTGLDNVFGKDNSIEIEEEQK